MSFSIVNFLSWFKTFKSFSADLSPVDHVTSPLCNTLRHIRSPRDVEILAWDIRQEWSVNTSGRHLVLHCADTGIFISRDRNDLPGRITNSYQLFNIKTRFLHRTLRWHFSEIFLFCCFLLVPLMMCCWSQLPLHSPCLDCITNESKNLS